MRWVEQVGRPVGRSLFGAVLCLGISGMMAAQAETLTREQVRLRLLDHCVYDQTRLRHDPDTLVKRCQCASKTASDRLQDGELVTPTWSDDRITDIQKSAMRTALRGCD